MDREKIKKAICYFSSPECVKCGDVREGCCNRIADEVESLITEVRQDMVAREQEWRKIFENLLKIEKEAQSRIRCDRCRALVYEDIVHTCPPPLDRPLRIKDRIRIIASKICFNKEDNPCEDTITCCGCEGWEECLEELARELLQKNDELFYQIREIVKRFAPENKTALQEEVHNG